MDSVPQFLDPRPPDRFWSKCIPEPNSGCWLWFACIKNGYGQLGVPRQRKTTTAHRFAYLTLVGEVPSGLELNHRCRVTECCNPSHLEPVTHKVNVLRGEARAAHNARATECPLGYPLSGENLIFQAPGKRRRCKKCQRVAERNYKRRKRDAAKEQASHG